jgi:hypothetical protein
MARSISEGGLKQISKDIKNANSTSPNSNREKVDEITNPNPDSKNNASQPQAPLSSSSYLALRRASYNGHISFLQRVQTTQYTTQCHSDLKMAKADAMLVNDTDQSDSQDSVMDIGSQRAIRTKQIEYKEEDEEDEGVCSDSDEEEGEEEDEEEAFLSECKMVEDSDLAYPIGGPFPMTTVSSISGSSSSGVSGGIGDSSSAVQASVVHENGRLEGQWSSLGRDLESSYLRYSLRKQVIENYVSEVLCGDDGPFDNNCCTGLSNAMALDLLPLLGCMARSEAVKYIQHAEVAALYRKHGGEGFEDFSRSGRRVSTRRSPHSLRSRFQHLVCATQLSEPQLESLLEYGFIAGRGLETL